MIKNNLKIFVADADVAFAYDEILSDMGYRDVNCFEDSASCINSLVLNPDIVFLDYSIENNSGLDVLKKIKNINPEIHVVLLSEIEKMNWAVEGLKFGAYDLILKGDIEEEHIQMVVENIAILNLHKNRRSNNVLKRVASFFW